MRTGRSSRVVALLACAVALVAAAFAASGANAVTVRDSKTIHGRFHGGAGCGDTDQVSLRLPRGAHHVHATRPKVGQQIPNDDEERRGQVATVSHIAITRRAVTWTAVAGGSVCLNAAFDPSCTNPDSTIYCGPGWTTHTLRFGVRFRRSFHRTYIECTNDIGLRYKRVQHPRSCPHFGPGGANAGGVVLRNLRWRGWGKAVARASGIECGFRLPCANIPTRVRAYRRKVRCGKLAYTRLRARNGHGQVTVRLSGCPGKT